MGVNSTPPPVVTDPDLDVLDTLKNILLQLKLLNHHAALVTDSDLTVGDMEE